MQVSGALYYSNHTLLRYDELDHSAWAYVQRWRQERNVPLYAALFDFEYSDQKVLDQIPANWSHIANVKRVRIYQLTD
jgi:hypothetical protein